MVREFTKITETFLKVWKRDDALSRIVRCLVPTVAEKLF